MLTRLYPCGCKCACNPPCGDPGTCPNPPCPAINCDENCQVTATVSATKLGTATFAVDGGYGDHFVGQSVGII